jgi:hypothetical protein
VIGVAAQSFNNDEGRMTNDEGMTNLKRGSQVFDFVIGHSNFVTAANYLGALRQPRDGNSSRETVNSP